MANKLEKVRLNGKEISLIELNKESFLNAIDKSDIEYSDRDIDILSIGIYGVIFLFKKGKASAIFISDSSDKYIGKVVFIDSYGNELDIQDKYNLASMVYCDVKADYVKGRAVDTYRKISDYDNMECTVSSNSSGITLMYDILNNVVVDKLSATMSKSVKNKSYKKYNYFR